MKLVLVALLLSSPAGFAVSYSCGIGTSGAGHCYGEWGWQEQKQYYGAYTDVLQAGMKCPSGCGGFLTNEMWLADVTTPACLSNPYQACWVEAGFQATDGGGNPYYFWSDSRPMNSNTFNTHFYSQADVNDFAHFMIIQDARGGPGIYQVWIYNDSNSVLFNGTSTSNTMSASVITIGSELAGSHGASGAAWFMRQIWAVKPLGPDFTFWYRSQTDILYGPGEADPPESKRWLISPANPPPEGGVFQTSCCG
jgi:hypothetical protein